METSAEEASVLASPARTHQPQHSPDYVNNIITDLLLPCLIYTPLFSRGMGLKVAHSKLKTDEVEKDKIGETKIKQNYYTKIQQLQNNWRKGRRGLLPNSHPLVLFIISNNIQYMLCQCNIRETPWRSSGFQCLKKTLANIHSEECNSFLSLLEIFGIISECRRVCKSW